MSLKMLFQSENKRQTAAVCLMALLLSLFLISCYDPPIYNIGVLSQASWHPILPLELPHLEPSGRFPALRFQSLHSQPELTVPLVLL